MAAPTGNRNAAKGSRFKDAINKALAQFATAPDAPRAVLAGEALDKIAEVIVMGALAGDKDCWQEIANRLDGKPAQSLTLSGDEDAPLRIAKIELTNLV